MRNDGERILIERIIGGDHEAFDHVYNMYAGRLYAFAIQYCKNETDAEDIVQETFIKLWMGRSSIRNRDSLKALLFTIAHHRLVNAYKTRLNSPLYEDYVLARDVSVNPDGDRRMEYAEFESMVNRELDMLPPTQRRVIMMSRFESLSNAEIARDLGLSIQTVKNSLSTGLRHLRDKINDHNDIISLVPTVLLSLCNVLL